MIDDDVIEGCKVRNEEGIHLTAWRADEYARLDSKLSWTKQWVLFRHPPLSLAPAESLVDQECLVDGVYPDRGSSAAWMDRHSSHRGMGAEPFDGNYETHRSWCDRNDAKGRWWRRGFGDNSAICAITTLDAGGGSQRVFHCLFAHHRFEDQVTRKPDTRLVKSDCGESLGD